MEAVNNFLIVKKERIEEKRSTGGIIIDSLFHHSEELTQKNICYAEVIYDNENIPFLKAGDRIAVNPQKGTKAVIDYEDFSVILAEQYIAKIEKDGTFIVPPNSIMIKIRKEDKEALYSKLIIRNDGTKVRLFLQAEPDDEASNRSEIFVSIGEVTQAGENIKDVQPGDIAILDYTVDNMKDNVLYFDDEENKHLVIEAITTFHESDVWVYASRKHPRDTLVAAKNEQDITSPLLGVIRGDDLISRQPYIFLNHSNSVVDKISRFGISYSEKPELTEREILAVSDISTAKFGMKKGQTIIVKDVDIFDVQLSGRKIQAVLDVDIIMGKNKI